MVKCPGFDIACRPSREDNRPAAASELLTQTTRRSCQAPQQRLLETGRPHSHHLNTVHPSAFLVRSLLDSHFHSLPSTESRCRFRETIEAIR